MWQKYHGKGVQVIGIDGGENKGDNFADKATGFKNNHHLTYPILVDPSASVLKAYGVNAFPTNVVVDQKGVVRKVFEGYDEAGITAEIDKLTK